MLAPLVQGAAMRGHHVMAAATRKRCRSGNANEKKKKNGGDDEYVKPKTNAIAKKNRFTHRNLKGGHLGPHHLFYIIKFFLLNYSKRPSSHYKM